MPDNCFVKLLILLNEGYIECSLFGLMFHFGIFIRTAGIPSAPPAKRAV